VILNIFDDKSTLAEKMSLRSLLKGLMGFPRKLQPVGNPDQVESSTRTSSLTFLDGKGTHEVTYRVTLCGL
jgi:hypothetical protein